jgi:NAD(P)-dependent dehydrogenase (short-subunit alcohol dehydrogenase family)
LHTATGFLKAGCQCVYLISRKTKGENGLDVAVEELKKLKGVKGTVKALAADLSKFEDIKRIFSIISQEVGARGVDILVANAGTTYGGPFLTTPDSSTSKILDLNVRSVFNIIQVFTPLLSKAATFEDPSRVVIVASVNGISIAHIGEVSTVMYATSKAGVIHMGKNLAVELGPSNITVNTISPSFFPSKMTNAFLQRLGGVDELGKKVPLGRLGLPQDIAGAMIYLCSPAGSYISGVDLPIDGAGHHVGAASAHL